MTSSSNFLKTKIVSKSSFDHRQRSSSADFSKSDEAFFEKNRKLRLDQMAIWTRLLFFKKFKNNFLYEKN